MMSSSDNETQLTPEGLVETKKVEAQLDPATPEDNPELFPGRDEKAKLQDSYTPKFPRTSFLHD